MSIFSLPVELLEDILQNIASSRTPAVLSRICGVCRHWRNVCIQSPLFWTRIEVGDCNVCNYMFSTVFLARCQGSPIDLVAGQLHLPHSKEIRSYYRFNQDLSAVLTPHLHQVRSVAMFPGFPRSSMLLSLLRDSAVPMPLLQYVQLFNNSNQRELFVGHPRPQTNLSRSIP